jgi:hypothetical protein
MRPYDLETFPYDLEKGAGKKELPLVSILKERSTGVCTTESKVRLPTIIIFMPQVIFNLL